MERATPTISRVLDDGTLIELILDKERGETALALRNPQGDTTVERSITLASGEVLVPYAASNNLLLTGCVLLPSALGDFEDKAALISDVRTFIHRYVDLPETFEAIAAHYVLLTWVYDAFTDLPYLRLRGDYGSGKTRALQVIGSLCNKPFFASGASTVSPIFHIQDAFQGVLLLDEADFRYSDARAELTKILNNGTTAGMPVLRTITNRHRELNPQAFRVFGPKIVAMRESFADLALESRFFTHETTGRSLRPDIPVHLPGGFRDEATALRNRLLAWRFAARFVVGPDTTRLLTDVSPRTRQSSLALLSLVDDAQLRDQIARELVGEEARVLHERACTLEATMLSAILEAFDNTSGPHAPIDEIARVFNANAAERLGRTMSNKWVGGFVRKHLRLSTMKSGGVFVIPRSERYRVHVLAGHSGISDSGFEKHEAPASHRP